MEKMKDASPRKNLCIFKQEKFPFVKRKKKQQQQ